MQIVIDIPKDVIESAKSSPNYYPTYLFEMIWIAIVNGTPLPKGHGRLIDDEVLAWVFEKNDKLNGFVQNLISRTPTVVEADREE